ncbi:tyrosine-type recombinase/integrase [Herbaspirillum robiniae]|uniref:tyrosine-type recombinase/integrase n=1 Tax=Herbaspirillum robiniae TaxID=2014887 RepID=UPI0013147DED|nr:site-specific integrase [Herbaspirillum robiniae]
MTFRVKTFVRPDGETYPMLVDEHGMPEFYPTYFITSQIRGGGLSLSSMEQHLYSIMILYKMCIANSIDLEGRIISLEFLSIRELDEIRDCCTRRSGRPQNSDAISLAKMRKKRKGLAGNTQYTYLTCIATYVKWLSELLLARKRFDLSTAKRIGALYDAILIRRSIPAPKTIDNANGKGITKEQELRLFQILRPGSVENPFSNFGLQFRNYLFVKMLRALGPRRGEVLNLCISDIDFSSNGLYIVRHNDVIDDPRKRQPKVKTKERYLILSDSLIAEIRYYIIEIRKRIPNSRRHPYLFVVHKSGPTLGRPLSISGQEQIFKVLAKKNPDMSIHAHLLRHTWNDRYSEVMDENQANSSDEIEQWRNLLQGWAQGSKMSALYNARHIQRKANEASLKAQNELENRCRVS